MNASTRPDDSSHHGFKRITVSNWKDTDEIIHFPAPVAESTWVSACLKPQLNTAVPQEIVALFEVARGSMIYGWFFYPLITLAAQQFHRIQEAAARAACQQRQLMPVKTSKSGKPLDPKFSEIIEALAMGGLIDQTDRPRWEAARELRNASSHPSRQAIFSPGMAIGALEATTDLINKLFK